jgi:hypothetical protein
MNVAKAKALLLSLRNQIVDANGRARTEDFDGLRQVDAKVREASTIIGDLPGFGERMASQMDADAGFKENSRRVRLETLDTYLDSALRFLDAGVTNDKKKLYKAPDVSELTKVLPELKDIIEDRWLEAQKCQHAGAYLAAIIMMGSVLEALLLARVSSRPAVANRASAAPKDRAGSVRAFHDWNLSALIDVAAEVGWIKVDRKNFSHALRVSRNVVHPWEHVSTRADFDSASAEMSWLALKAAVNDLKLSA